MNENFFNQLDATDLRRYAEMTPGQRRRCEEYHRLSLEQNDIHQRFNEGGIDVYLHEEMLMNVFRQRQMLIDEESNEWRRTHPNEFVLRPCRIDRGKFNWKREGF